MKEGKPVPTCRQVSASGRLCGSPALRHKIFCYHHQRDRQRRENLRRGLGQKFQDGIEDYDAEIVSSLDLPAPDDPVAAGVCLSNTFLALASGCLPAKRAGLMLYNLQIIASNFATIAKYRQDFAAQGSQAFAVSDPEPVASLTSPHREADFLFSEAHYAQSLETDEPAEVAVEQQTAAAQAENERAAAYAAHPEGALPLTAAAPVEPQQLEEIMDGMSEEAWEHHADQLFITFEQREELKKKIFSDDAKLRRATRRLLLKYNPGAVDARLKKLATLEPFTKAYDEFKELPDNAKATG